MKIFFVICYFIVIYGKVSISLRVVGISAPSLKQKGESVTLTCDYDLEGGKLYSVKWYRDNEEFYRYMPKLRPPQHAHRLDGVKVDLEKSSARRVQLRDLTLKSRGLYRCEVSEEAPSFHSAQAETFMEVYYFPRETPRIVGYERPYELLEPLDVNCSSAKAFPAPDLQWHINGEKVTERSWLTNLESQPVAQGLMISTLGLRAPATRDMKIRCVAIIGTHRRERAVLIACTLDSDSSLSSDSANANTTFDLESLQYLKDDDVCLQSLNNYPTIKIVFLKYNTCLHSFAPVERLCSYGGMILRPHRRKMSYSVFEQIVLLKSVK